MPGLEFLSLPGLAWVVAVLAFAGLVHGTIGLGFPLVATPLIAFVTDVKTAFALVVPPTLAVVIVSVLRGGAVRATLRDFWLMPVWMLAGSFIGTRLFILVDPRPLTLCLALGMLGYLALDRLGYGESAAVRRHPRAFGLPFGLAGGFLEGMVNIAAPPLLVYFLALGLAPAALVKALNLCFFAGKTAQLTTLVVLSDIATATWLATVPLCLVAIGTLVCGMRVRERIDAVTYRRWLKRALAAMALLLLGQFALSG